MDEIEEGVLFMRAMAMEAVDAPAALRDALGYGLLEPVVSSLVEQLIESDSDVFDKLVEFVALGVARGVVAHLNGGTWISSLGRPVALVAAGEMPGDVCDDYSMSFEEQYLQLKDGTWTTDFAEQFGSSETE